MSPGLLMGEGMIERFKREAITIAHLNHPNIVSCYSVRQAEGLHFFVMRYIRGRSLEQLIHGAGRLPAPIVRSILCQVGSALTYAHRSRVVHRDIKPANILIDVDGNAVVTDFGIAKVARAAGPHPHRRAGRHAGLHEPRAVQRRRGVAAPPTSTPSAPWRTRWSPAPPPFTGSTLTVMQAQVEEPPPPIRDRVPECPPELEAAILRMLAKDPAERFPSMAEAKVALGATPLIEDDPLLAELSPARRSGLGRRRTPKRRGARVPPRAERCAADSASPASARSIVILPPPAELAVGDGFALVALVRGERSAPLPGRTIEWSTDSSGVLHIDRIKQVATAVAPGTVCADRDGVTRSNRGCRSGFRLRWSTPFAPALDEPAAASASPAPPKSVRPAIRSSSRRCRWIQAGEPLLEPTVLWNTSDVRVAVVTAEGWVRGARPRAGAAHRHPGRRERVGDDRRRASHSAVPAAVARGAGARRAAGR